MAKAQQQPEPAPVLDTPEEQGPPKSYRLQITLGMVSLILLQMLLLWFVLPPPAQTRERIGMNARDGVGDFENIDPVPPGLIREEDLAEIRIGNEPITVRAVVDGGNERFSLTMHVGVRRGREERQFERLYEGRMNRIIDRIETIMRQATHEERSEAELTTIKERAKRAINEIIGNNWVQSVLITNVTFEAT